LLSVLLSVFCSLFVEVSPGLLAPFCHIEESDANILSKNHCLASIFSCGKTISGYHPATKSE
jgi:hypothetical protein